MSTSAPARPDTEVRGKAELDRRLGGDLEHHHKLPASPAVTTAG
jgi:hypothetical protein